MTDDPERNTRAQRLRQVTFEFLSRRNKGESIAVEAFCELHKDLMPELASELEAGTKRLQYVREIQHAAAVDQVVPVSTPLGNTPNRPEIRGYQILQEISGGGQGTVFKAMQDSTGRTVAIKVVHAIASREYERFEREVRALASLDHPGIVSVIDRGRTTTGAHYLVMDFVAGCDLDQWVNETRNNSNSQGAIVSLFTQLAAALEPAHAAGIVHRDLKPSNVRVTPTGSPRIIDFGLAQYDDASLPPARALTVTGNIVGSIPWASPEQASGSVRQIGPASDVYSIGVMLYQSLVGQFPYPVDGPLHETIRHICRTPPKLSRKKWSAERQPLDPSLTHLVRKCLAKDPGDRFASAGELAESLQAYLDGHYLAARPKKTHRRKIAIALAVAAAASVFAVAIVQKYSASRFEPLVIQLPDVTNSIGMRFIKVPAGKFWMGSEEIERGHEYGETKHPVTVTDSFLLGSTEVTRGQFRQVMGFLPKDSLSRPDDCPVDFVSWNDAQDFCKKLGSIDGRQYRLPSEAEWEYACRAGTQTMFAGMNKLAQIAWYRDNGGSQLQPVATRSANNWGFYDMLGNAAEWTEDYYVAFPGDRSPTAEPRVSRSLMKVVRGGCITDDALKCRSASRDTYFPQSSRAKTGFRLVLITQSPTSRPH